MSRNYHGPFLYFHFFINSTDNNDNYYHAIFRITQWTVALTTAISFPNQEDDVEEDELASAWLEDAEVGLRFRSIFYIY